MNSGTGHGSHAAAGGVNSNSQGSSGMASDEDSMYSRINGSARASRSFGKECTVVIDVKDVKKIKASDIIRCVEELTGDMSVYAVVPKGANLYEVTLPNKEVAYNILSGIDIGSDHFDCTLLYSDTIIVSILHLPAYITDQEISTKLREFGVELLSPIQRRYYPGTSVADGTRYVRCKFPQQIKSLPYSLKFQTVNGQQYYRVLHDNQVKVCARCLDPGHVMKDCPDFICYKCGEQGHVAKKCTRQRCDSCGSFPLMCTCKICDKCHKDAQSCMCYREDSAEVDSQVDDATREEILEIQHDDDDKEEIENAKQHDESGESGEENHRSNVDVTKGRIETEEKGNNNQTIRSVTDSSDDRMVVEDFVKITNDTKNCGENCANIGDFKVAKRRRRRLNPVPIMKMNSMRRTTITK